jgi:hypothetical protein
MDGMYSLDTGLAHIAPALPDGPEVLMLFNEQLWSSSEWQSSSRQHPIDMFEKFEPHVVSFTLDHLKKKT